MNFSERMWKAVLRTWSFLFAVIALIASILVLFVVPASEMIHLNWFLVYVFISFSILSIFIRVAYDAHNDAKVVLPKVRTVIDPPETYPNASALLLLEPSELLAYDSIVSLYYLDGGIERLSGVGTVVNIQVDKMIQVVLTKNAEFGDKIEVLKQNKVEDLSRLIVKPSVPSNYLGSE